MSFGLILIFGPLIRLISTLLPQCIYQTIQFSENDIIIKFLNETMKEILKESIRKTNEMGKYSCKHGLAIFFMKSDYFYSFIVIAVIGYLIGFILYSYSTVHLRDLINLQFISTYSIIFIIGFFGFILNLIALIISSNIPCSSNSLMKMDNRISFICPSSKEHATNFENYFDNFFFYIHNLKDVIFKTQKQDLFPFEERKKPKDGILEIFFSFIFPILGFFKMNFDLHIIKELGPFHLLLSEVLFQISKDFISIIYKVFDDFMDKIQINQYIFITSANLIVLIGAFIYLELIELKFCNFDKDIKNSIALRSILEMEEKEEIVDNEIYFGDTSYGFNERDSINEYQNKES